MSALLQLYSTGLERTFTAALYSMPSYGKFLVAVQATAAFSICRVVAQPEERESQYFE
jgi:hypothetical protein